MLTRTMSIAILAGGLVAGRSLAGPEHDHGHGDTHATIGQTAPAFTLTSSDGKTVSLADFKGKVVVLEWTNHQCPVVNRYVEKNKTMQKTLARYKSEGIVWLAIDSSSSCEEKKADINAWRKRVGTDYPTLLDPSGKVGHAYGAKTTPHMFVIDKEGKLAYMGSMDDDRYGDAAKTQKYVSAAIGAALRGRPAKPAKTKSFGCSVKYKK